MAIKWDFFSSAIEKKILPIKVDNERQPMSETNHGERTFDKIKSTRIFPPHVFLFLPCSNKFAFQENIIFPLWCSFVYLDVLFVDHSIPTSLLIN